MNPIIRFQRHHIMAQKVHKLFFLVLLTLVCISGLTSQISAWRKKLTGAGSTVSLNPQNPNTVIAERDPGKLYVTHDQGRTWNYLGAPALSFIRQIIIHPSDTTTIFAAGEEGAGLRKSTDYGQTWKSVIPVLDIDGESVVYDPVHPDTLYAGSFPDGKVYRSVDRGETWSNQGSTNSNLCALAVRPDSANILYAGSGGGRISKSTNRGLTWKVVKVGPPGDFQETPKIVINSIDPAIAYATTFGNTESTLDVWKTTDGGEHWFRTALQATLIWGMDIDMQNPNVLYVGTFDRDPSSVYKTTDGGDSWITLDPGLPSPGSIWSVKVHPLDSNQVWIGMTSGSFGTGGIYRWSRSSTGLRGAVRDGITGNPVTNGIIRNAATSETWDLSITTGRYSFGYFDGDSSLTASLHAEVYPYYIDEEQVDFIADSIAEHDIALNPLDYGRITGEVRDSATQQPVHAHVNLYANRSIGKTTKIGRAHV